MGSLAKDDLEKEIYALVQEFTESDDLTVTGDMTFDDAGVSSLDVLQIVFRIEEAHDISIDTEDFYAVRTVANVVEYFWKHT